MKIFVLIATIFLSLNLIAQSKFLSSQGEKEKFANKHFEYSLSHTANARQTQNVKMTGNVIDKPELYKDVKKIAVLGFTVAFTSREGWSKKDKDVYGGIPREHFQKLADEALKSIYEAYRAQGFEVVELPEVMKAASYPKLMSGSADDNSRYNDNAFVVTAMGSNWNEPDWVNSIKSGITLVHADTVKARALARNKPFQDVVKEVGADAGINIALRFYVYNGEIIMGWGPLKRGLVIDLIPATGDPRIVWSATLKDDVKLDAEISYFDHKKLMVSETWKYDLNSSIPDITDATRGIFEASAIQLKEDQQK